MATQNSHPTKIRNLVLVAAAIVLLALFGVVFTPQAAQAQGTPDCTTQVLELAEAAEAKGYYGVSVDLASCQIDIIFEDPGTPPTTAMAAPVRPITVLEVTDLAEAAPIVALDYAKDSIPGRVQEKAPTVVGQEAWCAPFISDAQKVGGYQIGDAVYDCQLVAASISAHTPATASEMEDGIRYLVWVSNVREHVLPTAYETVYFDGVSLVYLTTLEVGDMTGVTFSWAVAVK